MFGVHYVVDILRGEKTEAVSRNNHDRLPLFGIGNDRSKDFWKGVLRQLVARGALRVKDGEYASLELVPETARPILRGETQVMLAEAAPETAVTRTRTRARAEPKVAPGGPPADENLFEALRSWRAAIAKIQSVPPYVIFHDTTLRDIAAVQPATLAELAEIKGMGGTKLERYGTAVLQTVGKFAQASVQE